MCRSPPFEQSVRAPAREGASPRREGAISDEGFEWSNTADAVTLELPPSLSRRGRNACGSLLRLSERFLGAETLVRVNLARRPRRSLAAGEIGSPRPEQNGPTAAARRRR